MMIINGSQLIKDNASTFSTKKNCEPNRLLFLFKGFFPFSKNLSNDAFLLCFLSY